MYHMCTSADSFLGNNADSVVPLGDATVFRNLPPLLTSFAELDSDSDFNPGSYVPEVKKRGRKTGDSRKYGAPPNKRRRKNTLDDEGRSPSPALGNFPSIILRSDTESKT